MSTRSKKRRPVRIETEQSQAYSTPAKTKKLADKHQLARDQANRIFELEQQIAKLSRGDKGVEYGLVISTQAMAAITTLTKSGFYGTTDAETASQLLMRALRKERFL